MIYDFLPSARKELNDAVTYYDNQRIGRGDEFVDEVEAAIARILQMPNAWQIVGRRARRCRTNRFPYQPVAKLAGALHKVCFRPRQRGKNRSSRGFATGCYGLVYQVQGEVALIVAVMHLSRRAGYWRGRLQ